MAKKHFRLVCLTAFFAFCAPNARAGSAMLDQVFDSFSGCTAGLFGTEAFSTPAEYSTGPLVAAQPLDTNAPGRVELCHRTNGARSFVLISVPQVSVPAHRAHGDAAPGEPVPGNASMVFDESCSPVNAAVVLGRLSQDHSCAMVHGEAYCWGGNHSGQLGDGTTTDSSVPVKVATAIQFSALTEFSVGTFGLAAAGQGYYTWGETPFLSSSTTPVPSPDLTVMAFSQLATGYNFACGLAPDHLAYCWGNNESGQLGDGTTSPRYVLGPPVGRGLQFVSLSSSSSLTHMCGLTAAGKAYCWGSNIFGQLGDGTTTDQMSPVAVAADLDFIEVATGFYHTCARTASHEVYCWGTINPGPPIGPIPTLVSNEAPLIGIIGGYGVGCVLTSAGEARCWGFNGFGTIGDGTWTDRTTPTTAAGGLNFAAISMGSSHVCGVTLDNKIYCWGYNPLGQLGDGTTTNRNTPVPVQLVVSP